VVADRSIPFRKHRGFASTIERQSRLFPLPLISCIAWLPQTLATQRSVRIGSRALPITAARKPVPNSIPRHATAAGISRRKRARRRVIQIATA
jgi:hypothetical protein